MNRKKTMATLLIAIFMISTLSVILPLGATDSGNYSGSIIKAADRLVALQSGTDYGWDWMRPPSATGHSGGASSNNLYGITAVGLIDAYLLTGDSAYYDAAKATADYMISYDPGETNFYRMKGVNQQYLVGFDFVFLMKFAEVSVDTTYSDKADSWWDYLKTNQVYHNTIPLLSFDEAQNIYDTLLAVRYSSIPGHAVWHCSEYGLAALMLGDDAFATEMANVLSTKLVITDTSRIVGWGKALKFYSTIGGYQTEIAFLTQSLINAQNTDGSWDSGGPSGQDTANAMMGLASARVLGTLTDAADYLLLNQQDNGGWSITSSGLEIPQVDSEILQALFSSLLKSNFVPGKGKGLNKVIPNDNFAKGRQK